VSLQEALLIQDRAEHRGRVGVYVLLGGMQLLQMLLLLESCWGMDQQEGTDILQGRAKKTRVRCRDIPKSGLLGWRGGMGKGTKRLLAHRLPQGRSVCQCLAVGHEGTQGSQQGGARSFQPLVRRS
jgi:hypothetical protein